MPKPNLAVEARAVERLEVAALLLRALDDGRDQVRELLDGLGFRFGLGLGLRLGLGLGPEAHG